MFSSRTSSRTDSFPRTIINRGRKFDFSRYTGYESILCTQHASRVRSKYPAEQVAFALRQAESGTSVPEICRKMGIAEQTFYRWKKKYVGMGVAEVRRLRVLEEENRKLKQLVADLSLDKQMLQDVLRKKP